MFPPTHRASCFWCSKRQVGDVDEKPGDFCLEESGGDVALFRGYVSSHVPLVAFGVGSGRWAMSTKNQPISALR